MMQYSFDANVFLDMWRLKNPLYPHDVFSSLLDRITALARAETIFLCREAFDEVTAHDQTDDAAEKLRQWRKDFPAFVRPTTSDQEVVRLSADIVRNFPNLIRQKKGKGEEVADPFIIAHAKALRAVVVTNERPEGKHSSNFNKIPDVCREFKVECINLIDFMRREGMQF